MIRFDRPAFRSSFLAGVLVGVLALLSIVLALPGSAAAGRDGRADDGVPAEPTGLGVGVQPGALEVGVSWDDVPGATSYSLSWRRPGGGFQPGDAVIATDTEATLAVPDHGLWRLRLQACNDAGCGPGRAREVALVQEPIVTGASDPATGSTLTLTGVCADVTVTVLASEAAYTSMFLHFDMSDMSMATDLMITNRQVGSTMVLRGLSAGELVLGIRVQETGDVFRTGPASRNPDGLIHAQISGPTVSFEDDSGGGDEDFNDAVLLVTQASCGGSPPPPPPLPGNTQPDNSGNTPPDSNDGDPPPDFNDGDPPPDFNDGDPPPDFNDGDPPPDFNDGDPPPDSNDGDPPPDSNDGDPPPDSNDGDPPPDSNDGDPPPDSNDGDPPPDSNDGDPPLDSNDGDPPPDSDDGDAAARGPELLPNTGSGGIAGSGGLAGGRGLLALAVALAVSVALAGMAVVRRTRA